ncbi:MAG: NADH-quinone oxidoreductase subunit H [Myxococcota bacterium]
MTTGAAGRLLVRAGPTWSAAAILLAFAVVPWTGHYAFGSSRFALLPARLDWGVLFALAMLLLSGLVRVLAEISDPRPAVALTGMRRAARFAASSTALWLSLLPILLIFGSLQMSEIVNGQDSGQLRLPIPAMNLWLPAWGILLNPPAAVIFLVAAMAQAGLSPFDVNAAEEELAGGRIGDNPAARSASLALTDRLRGILIAALASGFFLGGWSLPWIPQAALTGFFEAFVGGGVANFLSLAIHFVVFALKVGGVLAVQRGLARTLGRVRFEPVLNLCWKVLLPAALLDTLATAAVLAWRAGGGP